MIIGLNGIHGTTTTFLVIHDTFVLNAGTTIIQIMLSKHSPDLTKDMWLE
jgi:hypothetical protein